MKTKVVHCRKEDFDVFVDKPSQWANPFEIGRHGTREEVVQMYRDWLTEGDGSYLLQDLPELKGKILGCWCAPELCHAHVLAELADELEE